MAADGCFLREVTVSSSDFVPLSMDHETALAWIDVELAMPSTVKLRKFAQYLEGVKQQVSRWKEIRGQHLENLCRNLNECVFRGAFSDRVYFKFFRRGDAGWMKTLCTYGDGCRGDPVLPLGGQESLTCEIRLHEMQLSEEDEGIDLVAILVRYVGILLHEMCHKFLVLAVCACHRCRTCSIRGEGMSGHGGVWQQLTNTVRCFAEVQLGFEVLHLDKEVSMALEMYHQYKASGVWHSNEEDTRRLGMFAELVSFVAGGLKAEFDRKSSPDKVADLRGEYGDTVMWGPEARSMLARRIDFFSRRRS